VISGTMTAGTNPELEVGPNRPGARSITPVVQLRACDPVLASCRRAHPPTRITLFDDPQLHFIAEAPPTASLNDLKPTDRCVCIDVHTDVFSSQILIAQGGRPWTDTRLRHQPSLLIDRTPPPRAALFEGESLSSLPSR
jgi:hypothetical protein